MNAPPALPKSIHTASMHDFNLDIVSQQSCALQVKSFYETRRELQQCMDESVRLVQ